MNPIQRAFQNSWLVLKETFKAWHHDNVILLAGAISFFTLFSLIPILILLIALAGQLGSEMQAQDEIFRQAEHFLNPEATSVLMEFLAEAQQSGAGAASVISVILLFFFASRVFLQIREALNIIWNVKKQGQRFIWNFLKGRLVSGLMILGIGGFLLAVFVLNTFAQTFISILMPYLPQFTGLDVAKVVSTLLSFGFFYLFCVFVYRMLPQTKVAWKDVWGGALLTSVLFMVGQAGLTLYFKLTPLKSLYGAAGSVVVLLLWIYFSAQIFLLGAEFTKVYASHFGSRQRK